MPLDRPAPDRRNGRRAPRSSPATGAPGIDQRKIALLATRQRGNVTTAQLLDAGLTDRGIRRWRDAGRLHAQFRGVYRLGHLAPIPWSLETAALLVTGPGAALSHLTAAAVWGLVDSYDGPLHVTTPTRSRRTRSGLRVHHSRLDPATATTRRLALRVCTPLRTLAEIHALLDTPSFERAVNEAQVLKLVTTAALATGPPALRALAAEPGFTRKEAERAWPRSCGVPVSGRPAPT